MHLCDWWIFLFKSGQCEGGTNCKQSMWNMWMYKMESSVVEEMNMHHHQKMLMLLMVIRCQALLSGQISNISLSFVSSIFHFLIPCIPKRMQSPSDSNKTKIQSRRQTRVNYWLVIWWMSTCPCPLSLANMLWWWKSYIIHK